MTGPTCSTPQGGQLTSTEDLPDWARRAGITQLGDERALSFRVSRIELTTGEAIVPPGIGVTAIVGGNNAGKSTLLRQIYWSLTSPHNFPNEQVQVVSRIELDRSGTVEDWLAWLGSHASIRELPPHQGGDHFSRPNAPQINVPTASASWAAHQEGWHVSVAPYFTHYAETMARLGQLGGVAQRGDVAEPASAPLHQLQDNAASLDRLNALSERIFRSPITLDDYSGNMRLRLGSPTVERPISGESQLEYRKALSRLRPLEEQGDGMKSLLGLLLPLVAGTYRVVIVDEPEAFLHPPQAYALGLELGSIARDTETQIILATHDRNLLAGLLSSGTDLSVVRVNREGNDTKISQLSPNSVKELWDDPVLRYTNVLDGLFHQRVVIAEADRDCRFFGAALDSWPGDDPLPVPSNDVHFVPSNGKAGISRLVSVLQAVSVPVVASPDLDVLNDETIMKGLVAALGGDWSAYAQDYKVATAAFRAPREPLKLSHIRAAMLAVLDAELENDPGATLSSNVRQQLRDALRTKDSPWADLKQYGELAFRGEAALAAQKLFAALDTLGLIMVRVGELEGFAPTLGVAKGKEWLPAAIQAGAHKDAPARDHVRRLVSASPAGMPSDI